MSETTSQKGIAGILNAGGARGVRFSGLGPLARFGAPQGGGLFVDRPVYFTIWQYPPPPAPLQLQLAGPLVGSNQCWLSPLLRLTPVASTAYHRIATVTEIAEHTKDHSCLRAFSGYLLPGTSEPTAASHPIFEPLYSPYFPTDIIKVMLSPFKRIRPARHFVGKISNVSILMRS